MQAYNEKWLRRRYTWFTHVIVIIFVQSSECDWTSRLLLAIHHLP